MTLFRLTYIWVLPCLMLVCGVFTIHSARAFQLPEPCRTPASRSQIILPPPPDCGTGDLIGLFHDQASVVSIDSATGEDTALNLFSSSNAALLVGATALTYDASTATLYAATGDGSDLIYAIHQGSGIVNQVAQLGTMASNVQAVELAPTAARAQGFLPGMLYAVDIDGSATGAVNTLWMINPLTGRVTKLANLPTQQLRGLSFNPITGQLWGLDNATHQVVTISNQGVVMPQFTVPVADQFHETGINAAFSLGHSCTGSLYTVDMAYGVLVQLDPLTQQGYWVNEYGALSQPTTGSFDLQGLDTYVCS